MLGQEWMDHLEFPGKDKIPHFPLPGGVWGSLSCAGHPSRSKSTNSCWRRNSHLYPFSFVPGSPLPIQLLSFNLFGDNHSPSLALLAFPVQNSLCPSRIPGRAPEECPASSFPREREIPDVFQGNLREWEAQLNGAAQEMVIIAERFSVKSWLGNAGIPWECGSRDGNGTTEGAEQLQGLPFPVVPFLPWEKGNSSSGGEGSLCPEPSP